MQWMKEANPQEDFILILDPDVLIRRPILPAHYGVVPGRPAAFNAWCGRDHITFTSAHEPTESAFGLELPRLPRCTPTVHALTRDK